jgi:hypothetical protein
MRAFPLQVLVLWACSALAQLVLIILLFSQHGFRKLRIFTTYVCLNLAQAAFLAIVYSVWGVASPKTPTLAWYSESVTLDAQAFGTAEILKLTLRPYQGIWGLVWRSLMFTSSLVVLLVAFTTQGSWQKAKWFELDRGYHLTFAATVIVCLLVIRYYSIQVPSAFKMILAGFCFNSCVQILINTLMQTFLRKTFDTYLSLWPSSTMAAFLVTLFVWVAALWKPLPADVRQTLPPPDSVYQQLSPEINERLRELDGKLQRLWKMEARPQ